MLKCVGLRSIRRTECRVVGLPGGTSNGARRAQASVAFGASYVILRRIKHVPMPRGAASEVACGRLSEVSILWTGVIRTSQASVAFGASYAHLRRI